jgi:DNA gyrase subunit A
VAKGNTGPSLFDLPDSGGDSGNQAPPPASTGGSFGDGSNAIPLHEAAQARYLNYALSVITSRALPDVRDGLKPVQRRILYTMWQQNLTADTKHRKCAKVVGDVMGNYHPHGDAAIYDTLVRMAQGFSLRVPQIDGSGNFGSLDGDAAAAMRYTECRLARVADEMLQEIEQQTVSFRPNYDGTRSEPVVLPARFPNLLVNGATGIAVGMATNIPPHNLKEVCTALIKLLDDQELSSVALCRYIKGPDFPTGGHVLNSPSELKEIYRSGQGTIRIRATWENGSSSRAGKTIYITSIPYGVNKAQLVERIGDVVLSRKMPHILDVKDLSTDDVRIELQLKAGADENLVMAYLFRNTPLQTTFAVNMTCLVPIEGSDTGRPQRLELREALWHFLHFRLEVVTARLEHELQQLRRRIHLLEGFEKVFDALDEIIRIIRKSDGKADAAEKIIKRFALDAEQADAILELKLYRLARLEILVIQNELAEKRKRSQQINTLLKDDDSRWKLVREELEEIQKKYGEPRRTRIEETEDVEYTADAFIVEEDNVVIVSRDGWIKRQKEVKDLSTTRLREGDSVLAAAAGSTRATVVFFSNVGVAYTARIVDIPASTGYGEPIQKLFKLRDGERSGTVNASSGRSVWMRARLGTSRPRGRETSRPCTRSQSPATAMRCASRSSLSSSRARARVGATRGRQKAPRSSLPR